MFLRVESGEDLGQGLQGRVKNILLMFDVARKHDACSNQHLAA